MRKLLVILLVLGVVLVGADRLAAKIATDEAEQRLAAEGLADPSVAVGGFPFVTQMLSRTFDEVEVSGSSFRTGSGHARDVTANGMDVRAPRGGDVVVGRLSARGTIPYAEVLRRAGRPGLSLSSAGDGELRLRREVTVSGRTMDVTAQGRVQVRGDRVRLQPTGVRLADGAAVDGGFEALLAEQVAVAFTVPGVPDGVRVDRVTASEEGFVVDLSGTDLELSSLRLG